MMRTLAATLLLSLGLLTAAVPAHAAPTIIVCNSSASDDAIIAYNSHTSPEKNYYILAGGCSNVDDYGGYARVDVDPAGGAADIDSWEKKVIGGSYGECYHSENGASNPYSPPGADGTTYHTSRFQYCE